jgi:hypothetical protein
MMRLVRRQKIQLKCSRDHYLGRMESWRDRAVRTADRAGTVGALAAAPA